MPPSLDWEDAPWEEGGEASAAAVLPDVASSMRQFVQALTTPETELAQQILEEVDKWAARHEPPAALPFPSHPPGRCLAGSSMNNSRGNSPGSSAATDDSDSGRSSTDNASANTSSRGSEEGSSTAWRLCAWLQRAGWPAQHRASIRTGSSGGGSASGWQFCSGHEFLLFYPHRCRAGAAPDGAAIPTASACSSDDDSGGGRCGGDSSMCDASPSGGDVSGALVVDPEFSTQFALAAPTPRYHMLVSLLPRVFVGSYHRLQQLVEWVCCEMQLSFMAAGNRLPPWRSLAHVLDKWRLQEANGGCSSPPPLPQLQLAWGEAQCQLQLQRAMQRQQQQAGSDSVPSICAAFSAEQQQAMRQLLLLQALQSGQPVPRQALTTSSTMSSMDAMSPQPPTPRSRSLLTRELVELAQVQELQQATSKQPLWRHQSQWDSAAAAVQSIAMHGGSP